MPQKLPNEIALHVAYLTAEDSTLNLKPLVLANRQWHAVAAPILLSTISICTLGQLVKLCKQIISTYGSATPSWIAQYTKTIVISGDLCAWREGEPDNCFGLEDFEQRRLEESEWNPAPKPDIDISPQEVSTMMRAAFSNWAILDNLEWYGRFAGDYSLVKYLQEADVIRHLVYGIEMCISSVSPAYHKRAFLFQGLSSLTITCECEPEDDIFTQIAYMMHHNPGLQSITFDCMITDSPNGQWSLIDLICDSSFPDRPIFVWPDLQHLVLRFFRGSFWQSFQEVELLTSFLVAHPKLETLLLHESWMEDSQSETACPLSLTSYPGSLPRLKKLLGSPRLIAGVLESRAACSSVYTVIDDSEEGFDCYGAKAPYIERITQSLKKAPKNRVRRLRLEIPQLSHSMYAKLARIAPNIQFLELLRGFDEQKTTPQDDGFDPITDIPSGLREFPNLEVIGHHIAIDFVRAFNRRAGGLLELARLVPKLKSIHGGDGVLVTFIRGPNHRPYLPDGLEYLDNQEYDWMSMEIDWRHRPMSRRAQTEARESEEVAINFW